MTDPKQQERINRERELDAMERFYCRKAEMLINNEIDEKRFEGQMALLVAIESQVNLLREEIGLPPLAD